MKREFSLLAGIVVAISLSNGSYLQAQSVAMSLTTPGTNNVLSIKILANTSLLGSSSDTKPFNMTGGYTVDLDSTYDANSRTPTLNNLAFSLDNPGNILLNDTGGSFHLKWETVSVALPVAPHLDEKRLLAVLENRSATIRDRAEAASALVWLRRCRAGDLIDVGCLKIKQARVIHMPGELFVEYQLAAQQMRPDLFVAMAAYGDYGPGYIGTEVSYQQGGYETGPKASLVAPSVETTIMDALSRLLHR